MVAIAMFGEVGVSSVRCRKASMDNAVKKILLFVLLSASSALGMAANQRSPAEEAVKILSCEGIMEETVPDDISDSAKKVTEINNSGDRQVSQVYEMKSNLLVAKGGMALLMKRLSSARNLSPSMYFRMNAKRMSSNFFVIGMLKTITCSTQAHFLKNTPISVTPSFA